MSTAIAAFDPSSYPLSVRVPGSVITQVAKITVPAGNYVVNAKVIVMLEPGYSGPGTDVVAGLQLGSIPNLNNDGASVVLFPARDGHWGATIATLALLLAVRTTEDQDIKLDIYTSNHVPVTVMRPQIVATSVDLLYYHHLPRTLTVDDLLQQDMPSIFGP